ncbi:MAG: hypothetical protein ACH344_08185 [Yersinia sp. (in: enterobacteria)]
MLKKLVCQQYQFEMLILEERMPQNHLARDANDYEFILNEASSLCCHVNGCLAIDPVVLSKMMFPSYLFVISAKSL